MKVERGRARKTVAYDNSGDLGPSKPLTRSELEGMRPTKEVRPTSITRSGHRLDDALVDRIEATIEHGWAADPPTPADLDAWAARKIMRWHRGRSHWVDRHDTAQYESDAWRPSQNLGQALECVAESNSWISLILTATGNASVGIGDAAQHQASMAYDDPYDEAAISEAVMRRLHAELAS